LFQGICLNSNSAQFLGLDEFGEAQEYPYSSLSPSALHNNSRGRTEKMRF
jgi:hypothetical protein